MWLLQLPVIFFMGKAIAGPGLGTSLTLLQKACAGIFGLGLGIETLADYQKFKFKCDKKNEGKFMQSGLFKYIQHPNYTGEIMCWWSIFGFCAPALTGLQYLSVVSPIWITVLLMKVSGIPLLRKQWKKKYGHMDQYWKWRNSTWKLFPGLW